MSRVFDMALAFVLNVEGGDMLTDDPSDPGGLTRWGVSQRAHPDVDVANLTREGAESIYRAHYWDRCQCDKFTPEIGIALFDAAVNQGPDKAIRVLQRALGVDHDGIVGPETLEAAERSIPSELLIQFLSRRAVEYSEGSIRFRRGWFVRLFRLHRAILGLA